MRITVQSRRYASLRYTDNSRNLVLFSFAPRRHTLSLSLPTSSLSRISITSLHNSRSIALSSANKPRTVSLSINLGTILLTSNPIPTSRNVVSTVSPLLRISPSKNTSTTTCRKVTSALPRLPLLYLSSSSPNAVVAPFGPSKTIAPLMISPSRMLLPFLLFPNSSISSKDLVTSQSSTSAGVTITSVSAKVTNGKQPSSALSASSSNSSCPSVFVRHPQTSNPL